MKKNNNTLFCLIVIAVAVLIIVFLVLICAGRGRMKREDFVPVAYTVQKGDSPYKIARMFCPECVDRNLYLQWCADENGRRDWNGYIYPGEVLVFLTADTKK